MFKANNKNTKMTPLTVALLYLLTVNIFHTFFSVSIVDFEQVNVSWADFISDAKQVLTITFSEVYIRPVKHP